MFRACKSFVALALATVEVTGAKHKLTAAGTDTINPVKSVEAERKSPAVNNVKLNYEISRLRDSLEIIKNITSLSGVHNEINNAIDHRQQQIQATQDDEPVCFSNKPTQVVVQNGVAKLEPPMEVEIAPLRWENIKEGLKCKVNKLDDNRRATWWEADLDSSDRVQFNYAKAKRNGPGSPWIYEHPSAATISTQPVVHGQADTVKFEKATLEHQ